MTQTQIELSAQFRQMAELVEEDPLNMKEEAMKAILSCLKVITGQYYHTDMSLEDVARYFCVTTRTVHRWQKELDFPEGKRIGYHESSFNIQDIIRWKQGHEHVINKKKVAI